jgi:hypothetical protein
VWGEDLPPTEDEPESRRVHKRCLSGDVEKIQVNGTAVSVM